MRAKQKIFIYESLTIFFFFLNVLSIHRIILSQCSKNHATNVIYITSMFQYSISTIICCIYKTMLHIFYTYFFFIILCIFYHERAYRTFLIIQYSIINNFVIDFIIIFLFNEFLKLSISMKSMSKFDSSVD